MKLAVLVLKDTIYTILLILPKIKTVQINVFAFK